MEKLQFFYTEASDNACNHKLVNCIITTTVKLNSELKLLHVVVQTMMLTRDTSERFNTLQAR